MRIARIDVYQFTYTLAAGTFAMSGGKTATTQDATIVKITTDDGLAGWGETCPFSPTYIAAHGAGARAAIREIGPALLGADPCQTAAAYARMERALLGHYYAKSALDMACWDILGRAAGLPVSDLLGGTFQPVFPLYMGVSLGAPGAMRDEAIRLREIGYRRLQLKVGGQWRDDVARVERCLEVLDGAEAVIVDANAYWPQREAVQVAAALDDTPVSMEQPCRTIGECAAVRARSRRPFILDESLTDLDAVAAARAANAMDAVMLKLSRFGGITPIRRARDLCEQWGLAMTIEDAGGDIVSAATAHLTASVRPGYLVNGFLPNDMVVEHVAARAPRADRGEGRVPPGPGLGIEVDEAALGAPFYSVTEP
jgi:cis-L-3-hydroxyproline dehydratase